MFYVGLDLGKMRDYSALAVVEREDRLCWTPAIPSPPVLRVRHLERFPLGTPYMRVVARVSELTCHSNLNGVSHLVVDATGVGVPVVESLRAARLGCLGMTAVTITPGSRARQGSGFGAGEHWNVPRTDLLSGVQMLLERGELRISKKMRESGTLLRELLSMRSGGPGTGCAADRTGGEPAVGWAQQHDDLVLAVALACWQAMRPKNGMGGLRLPGI